MNTEDLDPILERQLVVAWAGESAESSFPGGGPRLGWWRAEMTDEYGGADLMRRLTPRTWEWAVLEAARLAAMAVDRAARAAADDPDHLLSLFRLGFETDERLAERIRGLKMDGVAPAERFPALKAAQDGWTAEDFAAWAGGAGEAAYTATATGRRLRGDPPEGLTAITGQLTAALCPPSETYPLPYYRLAR